MNPPQYNEVSQTEVKKEPTRYQPIGPIPTKIICSSCNNTILTDIQHEASIKTHLIALSLLCCFCWLCAQLPYNMNSCKNSNHYCPNCHKFIGKYSR